jgi:cytochrome bd-type quinol oxidase subunit 2
MGGAFVALRGISRDEELSSFVGSSLFLAGTLLAGGVALAPMLLRSTLDPAYSLDAARAASATHGLSLGLYWFTPAIVLAAIYVVMIVRATRGKADPSMH